MEQSEEYSIKKYLLSKEIIDGEEPTGDMSYKLITEQPDLKNLEDGINLSEFEENSEKRLKDMEFRVLRRITETNLHTERLVDFTPYSATQNRYNNIIPYKHSRIFLPPFESEKLSVDKNYDYINADIINTSLNDKRMIATQGPVTQSLANFWKMIFYEDVQLIIMLCDLIEKNKDQCEQYWPKLIEESLEFPSSEEKELKITLKDVKNYPFRIDRILLLERKTENEYIKKYVTQIQWIGWNDHTSPTEEQSDLMRVILEKMVSDFIVQSDKKILIHCSAGIGRSGTLLALFNIILVIKKYYYMYLEKKESLKNLKISIFGTVRRLREQRWGMVHTTDQYIYLYKFISGYLKNLFSQK